MTSSRELDITAACGAATYDLEALNAARRIDVQVASAFERCDLILTLAQTGQARFAICSDLTRLATLLPAVDGVGMVVFKHCSHGGMSAAASATIGY